MKMFLRRNCKLIFGIILCGIAVGLIVYSGLAAGSKIPSGIFIGDGFVKIQRSYGITSAIIAFGLFSMLTFSIGVNLIQSHFKSKNDVSKTLMNQLNSLKRK